MGQQQAVTRVYVEVGVLHEWHGRFGRKHHANVVKVNLDQVFTRIEYVMLQDRPILSGDEVEAQLANLDEFHAEEPSLRGIIYIYRLYRKPMKGERLHSVQ
jgi:hypothetical protein